MSSWYTCHWYFWSWSLFLKEAYFLKCRDLSVQVNLQECDNDLNRNRISRAVQNKNWRPAASLSPQWLEIQGSRVAELWEETADGVAYCFDIILFTYKMYVPPYFLDAAGIKQWEAVSLLSIPSAISAHTQSIHTNLLSVWQDNCVSFMSGHSHFLAVFSHPFEHIRKRYKFLHYNFQLSFSTFAGPLCSSSSDIIFALGRNFCQGTDWLPAAISDKEKLLSFCVMWLSTHWRD